MPYADHLTTETQEVTARTDDFRVKIKRTSKAEYLIRLGAKIERRRLWLFWSEVRAQHWIASTVHPLSESEILCILEESGYTQRTIELMQTAKDRKLL